MSWIVRGDVNRTNMWVSWLCLAAASMAHACLLFTKKEVKYPCFDFFSSVICETYLVSKKSNPSNEHDESMKNIDRPSNGCFSESNKSGKYFEAGTVLFAGRW